MITKNKSEILIISQQGDAHIDFVKPFLRSPIRLVNPSDCIDGTELTYEYRSGQLRIIQAGHLIENVRSVWYRKPRPVQASAMPVTRQYQDYAETAVLAHIRELYSHFSDVLWVSDFYAIRRAENKGLQQVVAGQLGFMIPDTLTTSHPLAARKFISRYPETVVKSLATSFPLTTDGSPTMFYTRRIRRGQDFDLEGLQVAPAIFQQSIEHDFELRVTVVEGMVFAARVCASGLDPATGIRDWRRAHFEGNIDFEPYRLTPELEQNCVNLTAQLGLKYGAIDFISDTHGRLWFLEINPNGQWAFIEEATGQPIARTIAELLETGRP